MKKKNQNDDVFSYRSVLNSVHLLWFLCCLPVGILNLLRNKVQLIPEKMKKALIVWYM